jgi:thioredoxin reductase (NADPH)
MREADLIVLGAGAAGLTAAAFAARRGVSVLVIDRLGAGGQVLNAVAIENAPGIVEPIAGIEFGPRLYEQAEAAGAEITLDTVEAIEADGVGHLVRCADDTYRAPTLIIALGSTARPLAVPGEDEFSGKGVSHCASCDGPLNRGRAVVVVGGGDAAFDEALVLSEFASKVTILARGAAPRAQKSLQDRVIAKSNIEVVCGAEVAAIIGSASVEAIETRDGGRISAEAVFVYIGLAPNTALLGDFVRLADDGRIEIDLMMRTSRPGVFAAGDIRAHSIAQLAASAGDGATAAIAACDYLRALRRGAE